ncbi:hypothetical protein Caci_5135 [Catenulispora acidiphila DSM 44928]|uniref:Uncharacterized protein n=1 Tax=Catenulispora acidiphila (strain DSM 44928 / JCM 14897 / NBRC 102108 / NRRL B-24433 / ID139908) TaxID=479433 RepID=C7Q6F9_CATAD|nr:hypothetical protein [Catenulispora acidiphila]ACU73994.1 hypothetical protein Caci_5135 [Catenulispora acidiphila DSM 44928]
MNAVAAPSAGGVPLPTYNPWPDDPGQFDAVVAGLTAREDDVEEVRVSLSGLLGDPSMNAWMGKSADAFRSTLSPVPGLLGKMGDAYSQAASAVRAFAQKLRDGKASFAKVQSSLHAEAASAPQTVDGPGGLAEQLAHQAQNAAGDYQSAMRAAASAVANADDELRSVRTALSDPRYASFNATFTKAGGNLTDLGAGLEHLGDGIYEAQIQSLNDAMNNAPGALPPDAVRAELQDMVNQYGNIPDFWLAFGPVAAKVPGYLDQHDKLPDGSLPPADQALMSMLGKATAKAASAGDLNLLIAPTTGAGLLGLARLVAADGNGKDFGDGDGAQFLADLTTKLSDETANLPFNGPTDVYDAALSQALTAATQDGTAARLALSGDGGLKLATQLLEGSAPITETVGAYYTTMNENEGPHLVIDPNTIAGFLNAAILAKTPGSDPASQQGMQAALNVVRATAAFSSWDPSNNEHIYTVGPLPDSIRGALYNYGNAYSFDLAQSAADSHTDGVLPRGDMPGNPYDFVATTDETKAFLDEIMSDPKSAGGFQGFVQAQYSDAVKAAIQGGPQLDFTPNYANLVALTQSVVNGKHLSAAQQVDATNANHQVMFNMLAGALGNAPGPADGIPGASVGIVQTLDGLLQPTVGPGAGPIGRFFDTTHAAQATIDNMNANISQVDLARLLATQGAYDSGKLDLADSPGIVDATTRKVVYGPAFQSWWGNHENTPLGPINPKTGEPVDGSKSLETYAIQVQNAFGLHQ